MSRKAVEKHPRPSKDGNRLIDSLPSEQRAGVLAQCEPVEMSSGKELCIAGEPFDYVYFPLAGRITMVTQLADNQTLETDSVGCEGMLGATLVLDMNRAPQRGVVCAPCRSYRMKATRMPSALQRYPALCRVLQQHLYAVLSDFPQRMGCFHFHEVGQRLARSLLLAHDRVQGDQLSLTHQRLAHMLGVQRGAVTIAATELQRKEIIRYSRGNIFILDRQRLEASSCECYGASVGS